MNDTARQLKEKLPDISPDVMELNGQYFTPDAQNQARDGLSEKKVSKYRNVKTEAFGRRFDSGKEAKRAGDLRLLEKAGEIFGLCYQVKFPLSEKVSYIADFVYLDAGLNVVVEDCKGFKTAVYKLKRKLFKTKYGINITET